MHVLYEQLGRNLLRSGRRGSQESDEQGRADRAHRAMLLGITDDQQVT